MPTSSNCTHAIATAMPPPPGLDALLNLPRNHRTSRDLEPPIPMTTKRTSPVLLLRLALIGLSCLTFCITAGSSRASLGPKALYRRASWRMLHYSEYQLPHYLSAELRERFSDVQRHRLEVLQTHGSRTPRSRHSHYRGLPNAYSRARSRLSNADRLLTVPRELQGRIFRRRLLQFGRCWGMAQSIAR